MKFILVLIILLITSSAEAATYWVTKTSDGKNACVNSASPLTTTAQSTIAAGINCMSVGDTLYVRAGTYNETVNAGHPPTGNSWSAGGYSRIVSYSNDIVTITGGNPIDVYSYGKYIEIDGSGAGTCGRGAISMAAAGPCGFIFNATGGITSSVGGFLRIKNTEWKNDTQAVIHIATVAPGGLELYNSIIHDAGVTTNDNCVYVEAPNAIIDGNLIYNCTGAGIQFQHGDTSNGIARNNVIHDVTNSPNDYQFNPDGRIQGIILGSGDNLQVYNNVIYHMRKTSDPGVAYSGGGIYIYGGGTGYVIYNNTITDGAAYCLELDQGAAATAQNNICYNNDLGVAYVSGGQGPLNQTSTYSTNPSFVGATDFHLQGGSKAIGAGTALPSCPGSPWCTDLASVARPQGLTWEPGAYEYAAAVTVTVSITGANPSCTIANCTVTSASLILSGTSNAATAGAVTFSTDRGSSGGATWSPSGGAPSGYTTNTITLKAGLNHIEIASTDAAGNRGTANITVTYAPSFPGNSLVAAYGLEEGGGASATDSSGNGNTGTIVNDASRVQASFGKAISLNGTDQYISISNSTSLSLTQSFTLSAWVQPTISYTDFRSVIHKNAAPLNSPYELYASVAGYCGNGAVSGFSNLNGVLGPDNSACSATPLQINTPTHLALTYDGANLKLYKNGALIVTTAHAGYMEPSTGTLQIGATEYGEYFQGLIGQIRIYNYALPATGKLNATFGAICSAAEELASPSIIGDSNCPVVPTAPPLNIKVGAAAAGLKLGAGVVTKFGQVP